MRSHFRLSDVPRYAWLPLIVTAVWNQVVYCGAKLLADGWHHFDITTSFDRATPFWPWTVSIYFLSYIFWILCYLYASCQDERQTYRFLCADVLAKTICLVFFLLFPTTNVRPAVEGSSFWHAVMRFLYQVDSPTNLFPSIHCLVSWLCFLGVRDVARAPRGLRWGVLAMALAICLSTLTTKQHVIADVLGGVFLAQLCYWLADRPTVLSWYSRLIDHLTPRRLRQNSDKPLKKP